ncbi:hypothetical protein [Brevibacterium sp. K72]|uniref:hypothetical protein n=1 Tax=Brevibacterium sp. K72 TaxID=3390729 RepID=UPI003D2FCA28
MLLRRLDIAGVTGNNRVTRCDIIAAVSPLAREVVDREVEHTRLHGSGILAQRRLVVPAGEREPSPDEQCNSGSTCDDRLLIDSHVISLSSTTGAIHDELSETQE